MFELKPSRPLTPQDLFWGFPEFENSISGSDGRRKIGFAIDVEDADDKYIVKAELPGYDKQDISVSVNNGALNISATRKAEKEEKDEKKKFVRRERLFGESSRWVRLQGMDVENVKASYKDGILTIDVGKIKKDAPPCHAIEIE